MRASAIALILGMICAPAAIRAQATPPAVDTVDTVDTNAQVATFDRALADLDWQAAARTTDLLIEVRRPTDTVLRTDPLLNALVGRLQLARGLPQVARAYLDRAAPASLPGSLRVPTLFARARAEELMGDGTAATATLAALADEPLDAPARWRLALAQARLVLIADPAGVERLLAPMLGTAMPARYRWEAELLAGAARSLLGDVAGAHAGANRAWSAAAEAPARDNAAQRVALLRAAIAADRDGRLAMLGVAGAADHGVNGGLVDLLPICDRDVRPADFATFAVHASATRERTYLPVRASRTAVIPAFARTLAGRTLFETEPAMPGGSLVTLRCRSLVSPDYDVAPPPTRPWDVWFADKGLYSPMASEPTIEHINALSGQLIAAEERYGTTSPRLLPLIAGLGEMTARRAASEADVQPARAAELLDRFVAIMRSAGAPSGFVPTADELATRRAVSAEEDPAKMLAAGRRMVAAAIEASPTIVAYSDAMQWFARDADLPPTEKRRVIDLLLARFADAPDDERKLALLVRRAGLDSEDDRPAALRSLKAARAAPGSCVLADLVPKLDVAQFSDEDFPKDVAVNGMSGFTAFEVDVDKAGRSGNPRILFSSPAELFDDVARIKLDGMGFTGATSRGRAVSCTGYASRIRWRLPENEPEQPIDIFAPVGEVSGT